jgi:hypothetical protein
MSSPEPTQRPPGTAYSEGKCVVGGWLLVAGHQQPATKIRLAESPIPNPESRSGLVFINVY